MIIKQIKNTILDILFPINCLLCGTETTGKKKNKWICTACLKSLHSRTSFNCPNCDIRSLSGDFCLNCRNYFKLDGLLYPFSYKDKKIENIIKAFKYKFIRDLNVQISSLLNKYLTKVNFDFNNFLITAVPLSKRRLNWRGFNQTELIAINVYEFMKLNYKGTDLNLNILERKKHTLPQTELTGKERLENVADVFECLDSREARRHKILVIDDVYTTGATMNECAKLLKKAGAEKVIGLVFAKG